MSTPPSSPPRSWQWKCLQVITRFVSTVWFDMKVWGLNNIPPTGGVLLLSNHQSCMDPVLLALRLKRPVSYMARSDLFEKNRFFTWLITSLHAFPIKRATADIGALKQAIARLQEGHILNVYPEGTRTPDGAMLRFQPGVGLMAQKLGIPVVPVRLRGLFEVYSIHHDWPEVHEVGVRFGKPLRFEAGESFAAVAARAEREVRAL